MAKKLERWLTDIFPGKDKLNTAYSHLSHRELVVVAASVLDLALVELLSKRLKDIPKECEEFLGMNEDGRAPCGSFGSRIQLALLLGIISPLTAGGLRDVKNIRNKLAHRVNCTLTSPEVVGLVESLLTRILEAVESVLEPVESAGFRKTLREPMRVYKKSLRSDAERCSLVIRSALTHYQLQFHAITQTISHIA